MTSVSSQQPFGQSDVRWTLKSEECEVLLSSFGATIVKLLLPDKSGNIADCVLGFDTAAEYDRHRDHTNCFGATIGRVANRIGGAEFIVDAQKTKLAVNCGDQHHLHGGEIGWHRK